MTIVDGKLYLTISMPPKKSKAKSEAKPSKSKDDAAKSEQAAQDSPEEVKMYATNDPDETTDETSSKKRKKATGTDEPQKAQRRSGRGAPKSQPSQEQLLRYMLSTAARELCQPEDETEDIAKRGDIRTYSSGAMNPFEELLCSVILSRPISHRLGLRTIRTVLNDPYNFNSAKATRDAGSEKQHQALWDARTQHKDKTADQIGTLAEVVLGKFTAEGDEDGTQMYKVREECDHDVDRERDFMQSNIKGLGKTGLDIFFRRIQWTWPKAYPFVDDKTIQSLRKLGLPEDGEELKDLVEKYWDVLKVEDLAGDDEATKKRRAFTIVLERATGADLEGKHEALLAAAADAQ
ncbi:hypothetical protein LTR22_013769 [Elasticomyces elasticus]|nr:hypothetical protein LTR22_013769 [Elasticomyces elasticus]KAK5755272.1 hypothetical protein LTS12_014611 [Elasticomyces elasticus]